MNSMLEYNNEQILYDQNNSRRDLPYTSYETLTDFHFSNLEGAQQWIQFSWTFLKFS